MEELSDQLPKTGRFKVDVYLSFLLQKAGILRVSSQDNYGVLAIGKSNTCVYPAIIPVRGESRSRPKVSYEARTENLLLLYYFFSRSFKLATPVIVSRNP